MTIRMKNFIKACEEEVKKPIGTKYELTNKNNSYLRIRDDHPGHEPDPIIFPFCGGGGGGEAPW